MSAEAAAGGNPGRDPGRHLCVIPARGGSKRLPRKNVVDFRGRPILAYTLDAARSAGVFTRILVSTDDAEIGAVAERLGGAVDRRPDALGSDAATVVQVCTELLERLAHAGETYDTLTVLYATAPLRTAEDVRSTFALLEEGVCAYAMAVTPFLQPVHQALRLGDRGTLTPQFPQWVTQRKDAVGDFYCGNGSTYCVAVADFLRTGAFYGPGLRGHVMPPERSVDIDTAADLQVALAYAEAAAC